VEIIRKREGSSQSVPDLGKGKDGEKEKGRALSSRKRKPAIELLMGRKKKRKGGQEAAGKNDVFGEQTMTGGERGGKATKRKEERKDREKKIRNFCQSPGAKGGANRPFARGKPPESNYVNKKKKGVFLEGSRKGRGGLSTHQGFSREKGGEVFPKSEKKKEKSYYGMLLFYVGFCGERGFGGLRSTQTGRTPFP